mmetsp:Transcript_54697/g.152599  ORF Transcript_54697/g.152599 Transcript_54697/m.152599 type:complete len:322 (+) Transcript_54697:378-1343(+)
MLSISLVGGRRRLWLTGFQFLPQRQDLRLQPSVVSTEPRNLFGVGPLCRRGWTLGGGPAFKARGARRGRVPRLVFGLGDRGAGALCATPGLFCLRCFENLAMPVELGSGLMSCCRLVVVEDRQTPLVLGLELPVDLAKIILVDVEEDPVHTLLFALVQLSTQATKQVRRLRGGLPRYDREPCRLAVRPWHEVIFHHPRHDEICVFDLFPELDKPCGNAPDAPLGLVRAGGSDGPLYLSNLLGESTLLLVPWVCAQHVNAVRFVAVHRRPHSHLNDVGPIGIIRRLLSARASAPSERCLLQACSQDFDLLPQLIDDQRLVLF